MHKFFAPYRPVSNQRFFFVCVCVCIVTIFFFNVYFQPRSVKQNIWLAFMKIIYFWGQIDFRFCRLS